jgi:endonuclease/exonuclease/phosphatase (EEP) superfamily protein YafD
MQQSRVYHTLGLLVIGSYVWLALLATPQQPQPSTPPMLLRVMTYNIAGGMADQHRLQALLSAQAPDLLLVQEFRDRQQLAQLSTLLHLPYYHLEFYEGSHSGVGLLSRWPLGPAHTLSLRHSRQGKVALAAAIDSPLGRLWTCSVHLDNALGLGKRRHMTRWQQVTFLWQELFTDTLHYQQAQELRAWLRHLSDDNWIVGGDFNTVPWSRTDRYLRQDMHDALAGCLWHYFTGTYWGPLDSPLLPRIDFLYHSWRWDVRQARVLQQRVSDHFPILAEVSGQVAARQL